MTIDIKELRRLAQEANEHSDDRAEILAEFYAVTQSDTIIELLDRLEAVEKERDKLKELNIALCTNSNSQVIHNARLAEENYALRAKIEQMESGKREVSEAHNVVKRRLSALADENTILRAETKNLREGLKRMCLYEDAAVKEAKALRAKIEQMEKQKPVWFIDERGEPKRYHKSKADYCKYGGLDLLYALPGAQTQGEGK